MAKLLDPFNAAARIRAGESSAAIFRDQAGRPAAKLAGLRADIAVGPGTARAVDFTISTGSLDRYNSTIAIDGWEIDGFTKNPVVLWAHDDSIPAIARAENTRVQGGKLRSRAVFADAEMHPLADTIYRLIKGKFLGAASVGWIPLEWKFGADGEINYLAQELLEWSIVNIPGNSDCLTEARSFGINTAPLIHWAEHALDGGVSTIPRDEVERLRRSAGATGHHLSAHIREDGDMRTRAGRLAELHGVAAAAKAPPRYKNANGGFGVFAEFLHAVARGSVEASHNVDQRLIRAPTGAGEVDPSGGGFLVPAQWATEMVALAYEEATIAPRCDRRETVKPLADVKIPGIDETSRADGSRWGGALAYWSTEAGSISSTFPRFKNLNFSTKKLIAIAMVTNELMEDAPMLEGHLKRVFAAEMGFKLDLAALSGTGAGVPLGILNGPALISVPKETGQSAKTIVADNISKMWSRLPAPSRKRAVWLVNEEVEGQLDSINQVIGTAGTPYAGNAGMYFPAGAGGNEFPLLKGRPVLAIEQCPVLGTVGDIVLADFSHYVIVDGGINPTLSTHVQFVNDQAVWRFVLRVDGQPGWASPITPYAGTTTRSPFVALATRS